MNLENQISCLSDNLCSNYLRNTIRRVISGNHSLSSDGNSRRSRSIFFRHVKMFKTFKKKSYYKKIVGRILTVVRVIATLFFSCGIFSTVRHSRPPLTLHGYFFSIKRFVLSHSTNEKQTSSQLILFSSREINLTFKYIY